MVKNIALMHYMCSCTFKKNFFSTHENSNKFEIQIFDLFIHSRKIYDHVKCAKIINISVQC